MVTAVKNPNHHSTGAIHELPLQNGLPHLDGLHPKNLDFDPETWRNMLLPKIIGGYKMNVSKQANIIPDHSGYRFRQRNDYEHFIRNDTSLERIPDYIANNPVH